jgi:hypothetical protein
MPIIKINGTYANFVTSGNSFLAANNSGKTVDFSSAGNRFKTIYTLFDVRGEAVSGQEIYNDGTTNTYYVINPILTFEIPLSRIKTIKTANLSLEFNQYVESHRATTYEMRVVDKFRPYSASEILAARLAGTVIDPSFYVNPDYDPNNPASPKVYYRDSTANYIKTVTLDPDSIMGWLNGYNLFLLFAAQGNRVLSQENPQWNIDYTTIRNFKLSLDIIENTTQELAGFGHYLIGNSGFNQVVGGGGQSVYVAGSGFVLQNVPEDVGAVALHQGSGHIIKTLFISCFDRVITFPENDISYTATMELIVPPEFQVAGRNVRVCRWNTQPERSNAYRLVSQIPPSGGMVTFDITLYQRWFHFEQYDAARGRVVPYRIKEFNGKLQVIGF